MSTQLNANIGLHKPTSTWKGVRGEEKRGWLINSVIKKHQLITSVNLCYDEISKIIFIYDNV
jgi:hypothetical protein